MAETILPGVANQLRRNSLGVGAVTFMVISAAAPLTGAAGAVPISMLLGNGGGIPATFLLVTCVMLAFSVGYVAMARHVQNAGAFYAYSARGLGGGMGGATAIIALLSYNAMQMGLLGLLGGAAAATFGALGLTLPWWVWSFIAIAIVAVLGYRQVDLSAKVLTILVLIEYAVVLLVDAAILVQGGDSGLAIPFFDKETFFSGSVPVAILFCMGSFIGFEATTIYSEEARDPERTIPRATYLSVLSIGAFYILTTWLMVAGVGADKLMPTLQGLQDPTTFLFDLAGRYVGGPVPTLMGFLFITSLFAAVSAFHNYIARYTYVGGREGLLPAAFGATHDAHQSPHIGSISQTVLAVAVVGLFAGLGLDPVLNLFTWISQIGTLGVLGMMSLTSFAVIAFFRRNRFGSNPLAVVVMPVLAGIVTLVLFVYIFVRFSDLTQASGALGIVLPSLVPVAGVVGYLVAKRLQRVDPVRYARLGSNA